MPAGPPERRSTLDSAGFDYYEIPIERGVCELQSHFDRGETFSLEREVAGWLNADPDRHSTGSGNSAARTLG